MKAALRKRFLAARRGLAPDERAALDARLSEALLTELARLDKAKKLATVALYLATPDEANVDSVVPALWREGVKVAVPAWDSDARTYRLALWRQGSPLAVGHFGIREPIPPLECVSPREIDVWVVPGVAFARRSDGKIARLGYGGGYYDRFLAAASLDAPRIGVAYPCQIADDLPLDPTDQLLDAIVR